MELGPHRGERGDDEPEQYVRKDSGPGSVGEPGRHRCRAARSRELIVAAGMRSFGFGALGGLAHGRSPCFGSSLNGPTTFRSSPKAAAVPFSRPEEGSR